MRGLFLIFVICLFVPAFALAEPVEVIMHKVSSEGIGDAIGSVTLEDSAKGLAFNVRLKELPAGERGFHIHEKESCEPGMKDGTIQAAVAAGNHYDPGHTGKHAGPQGAGHAGDLPLLVAGQDGTVMTKFVVPRLKLQEIRGRTLMVHEGGDTYADQPKPLGGGGGRIACGVIPKMD